MNTIITPDNIPVTNLTPLSAVSASVKVKVCMTPEEIRELVAKARAADEERRLAKQALTNVLENTNTTPVESQAHPDDSIHQ